MSRTTLRAAGVSVIIAWAIWAAAYLVLYAIIPSSEIASKSLLPCEVYFPLTLLSTWLALTCMATIGQTGRSILFGLLYIGVPVLTLVVVLFSHFALTPEARKSLDEGIAVLVGVIYLLGTSGHTPPLAAV